MRTRDSRGRMQPVPPEEIRPRVCVTLAPDVLAWVEAERAKEAMKRSQFVEQALAAYRQQKEA